MEFFRSDHDTRLPGLVWAYRFGADGRAERIADETTGSALAERGGWLWLHVSLADSRARTWIAALDELPDEARAILLGDDDHPQLESIDGVVAGVISDAARDLDHASDAIGHLRFAITDTLVVSARRHALESVETARRALDAGRRIDAAIGLLELIVGSFIEASRAGSDALAAQVDDIEDRVLEDRPFERAALPRIRRAAVRLHRQLFGLRAILSRIDRTGASASPLLQETAHRLALRAETLIHDVQGIQERARFLQDEVGAKVAAQTNRLLTIISILTAVFVPPTFITGVFGMNTKGLVFAENENAFLYAMALCAASAAGVYALTRRLSADRG